ncbi:MULTISPECIES: AAA family ATPase [unclassified Clostridioides]|uniref:AAA family ATPase n=1 Tax=unclassified Clostridioides TaxID=2635829 RepID=UPI001D128C4F|nr:AAA family ATPase [Clostridioides sp. ZZV14-6150]MCC0659916.1 AAA family ATPase [Clostridioides sp. ZZV14-6154]MCC0666569.1 AAA family ATPase [Clostridioides sp. ZZV14-6153]MCC0722838.1 AAA family ATPase [Clostridioides sp. ZZV14-6104]MCC0725287.1 AAA family ATPase [Clostridioides sp. ZZV14-6045]MCC0729031.1 AAA family ATPase [Clostridioides sp. ZZV14-6048]MCC0734218.1 AAA family ATPase [Clostridioides sp. ZZV14-6009]MCC0737455.1 AAA family ATPase [Clostridioides sp. ZZV14-5902]MCC074237
MRPIRLELTGLNSYIDKQVIDFEKLIERGLFGIFGTTGSGKSTILDAITIAMYGNISRNTKEYINSVCDKAIISYEFEIGSKNTRRRYIVDRTIVRSKTGTKTSGARLVEVLNDNTKNVLADKVVEVNEKVAQVVGLTSNDFTRSVVLPQDKFNEFLRLSRADRRDMLERIFNLEKYGRSLGDKVKKRKNLHSQKLKDLKSKLSQYDGITEEVYNDINQELMELKKLEKEKNKTLDLVQKSYEESKVIYEEQLKLEKNELRKNELNLKSNEIKEKTNLVENDNNARKVDPYIGTVQNLEKRIEEDSFTVDRLDKKLVILNQELEITKHRYERISKIKNEEVPKLSEEKIKLQQAIKLEEELVLLDKELKELKENGLDLSKNKMELEKLKKDSESRKEAVIKSVKEIEGKIDKVNISAELKQKIFLAYEYEKDYNKVLEEKTQKINKLEEISKDTEDINLKVRYIDRDKNDINRNLESLSLHLDVLLKKCPGKSEDLLLKSEYVTELRNKANNTKENEIKKNNIQDELKVVLENKFNIERELNLVNEKLENNRKNREDLEKELEELKYLNLASELRRELKENVPCPVCGSKHHENHNITNYDENIVFVKDKLDKLEKEKVSIRHNIEELNAKVSGYVSVEKMKTKELEDVKGKLGEIPSSQLFKRLDDEQRKLAVLKSNIQEWEKEKESTENKITLAKEEKNRIEKEELKINESLNNYKKLIKDLNIEIESLEHKCKKLKQEYLGLKTITKVSNLSSKVEELRENEKKLELLNTGYSNLLKNRDLLDIKIREQESKLHEIELELIKARELYVEKKVHRESKYKEVINITKGDLAKNLLHNVEERICKILEQEESSKVKLEEQRLEYEKNLAEKHNIDGRLKTAKEQYKEQKIILNKLLAENKFESIYAVKRALLEGEEVKKLIEEILEYEEEQKLLSFKIKSSKEKLNGRIIKKEYFEQLKDNIYNMKVEIGNISKDIGANQNKLITLKDSLDKINDFNKELRLVEHKVDLLEELDKCIQGNKFVEYVSTNQLKYIALEASKRLEGITKGRYALEIDSTLNFVMRDNFNGGERRSIDTLSGGETFLTSLSLALALSSQIQLKGSAPLEFFFLDEGFGSLDSELLEIVIESLERLHSNNLSVGIISHVEELKNRVPVKLLVSSSEAGVGSKVKIEYS